MAGKNEDRAMVILESLGFVLGKDFVRQFPMGGSFVVDFAFINERVVLEIDGKSHYSGLQREKDKKRDHYLASNDWIPLRIKEDSMYGYMGSFYRNLIREVVLDRRVKFEEGRIWAVEIPNYDSA